MTTRWSMVLQVGQGDSGEGKAALERLCGTYWYPIYCCVRRYGIPPADAQDLTQGFFCKLLRTESIERADPSRGRFRTYLLRSLERYLHNQHRNSCAAKRGHGLVVPWDPEEAELRYASEACDDLSPRRMFEKQWAATLVYTVLDRLRDEFLITGRPALFEELEPHLWNDETSTPYAELGRRLGMSPGALRVTLHRLKRRFQALVCAEIAETIESPDELTAELAYLGQVLRQNG